MTTKNDMRNTLDKISGLTNQVKNNIINKTTIHEETGCWLYGDKNVYPRIYYEYNLELLTRLILGLNRDDTLLALHKQNCPHRNCWWSEHLYVGSQQDNTYDSIMAKTFVNVRAEEERRTTHCPHGHEYTPENTKMQGNKRKCRECHRLRRNPYGKRKLPEGTYYSSKKE